MKKLIKHTLGKMHLVFAVTENNQVKLIHFSTDIYQEKAIDEELLEASALFEMQVTGMNQPGHKGTKLGNSLLARKMIFEKIQVEENCLKVIQSYREGDMHFRVESMFDGSFDEQVIRCTNQVVNLGVPIGIEYLTTLNLMGIFHDANSSSFPEYRLHIPHNAWQGELQWQESSLKNFGLNARLDDLEEQDSTKIVSVTNSSSWSCSQYSPFVILSKPDKKQSFFWQLENNGEWHWELTDCNFGKDLALRAGGPTEMTNHWWKKLTTGESFTTIPVSFGCVEGGFNEGIIQLNRYRRTLRKPHQDNQLCPVIFNDYMNSLGGDPTTEKEFPMIQKAAEVGCEYYVVDCGWYAAGPWWDNVGEWLPSMERFPNGIEEVFQAIKLEGMIPGLWLEIEVMGINSKFANQLPDDWFICRHGYRIKDHSRYHLDFRNPEVRDYATKTVRRLIDDYAIGYIKMDYNTPISVGSDLSSDSFSDGLLQHCQAYMEWITGIMEDYPELVIENCGSGGMRHDYAMLAQHPIQSVTDQTDYVRNGAIAAVCSTGITPEQAAIWSYPMTDADDETVIFNMVNSMLLRIHQSGHLGNLSEDQLRWVKEGIAVYKEIRHLIPTGDPRWYGSVPHLDDPWFHFGLETSGGLYLAVWKTQSDKDYTINLTEDFQDIKQIFPVDYLSEMYVKKVGKQVTFTCNKNNVARLYKVIKSESEKGSYNV